ncbi:MAG: translation elongation factor Ts [Firmicutes bacterium]|nr:translation elongation factor Ts [Bacillota bacterium]
MIEASVVKALRDKTGAGMMECKKALTETCGDMDKAVEYLRQRGLAQAARKADRIALEGVVDAYVHLGGRIGVLIEVNCETDFVARNDEFKSLVHDLAMQVAAANPSYISREDVPAEVIEREKELQKRRALEEGKPAAVVDRIVAGRMEKFFEEICLLDQAFIRDEDVKVGDYIKQKIAKTGENIKVGRFVRYALGETNA